LAGYDSFDGGSAADFNEEKKAGRTAGEKTITKLNMIISSSDLINLPVFTQNGQHVGKVDSFEINLETNAVSQYFIKTGLIKGLWHQQLMVSPSQVISIDKEKMIIADNCISRPAKEIELAAGAIK
jgi:sporulation protein YlmC with PRC-barrel domain